MAFADYIVHKPTIKSNRLVLRPLTATDVPALKEWLPNPSVYTYWGKKPSKAEKNPELLFAKKSKPTKSFHLGIARKDNNQVIGDCYIYLIEKDRMAQVALRLSPAHQGKGYGTESLKALTDFCFSQTELQRLWTLVDVRNTASCRILEKAGYQREGHIRQGRMVNSWCDYYIYGILDSDLS